MILLTSNMVGVELGAGLYGSYRTYLPDPSVGIKLLHKKYYMTSGSVFQSAKAEFDTLKEVHNLMPDLFPKPIDMVAFEDTFGYMMEHIPMDTLKNAKRQHAVDSVHIIEHIKTIMEDRGIYHSDVHEANVLYNAHTGEFRVVDCDPAFIHIDKDGIYAPDEKYSTRSASSRSHCDDY